VIAYTFTIRTRERHQLIGQAVICLEARYVSVQWTTSPYPDRRFATMEQWKAIQGELDMKLPAAPLEDQSAIVQVMVGERASGVSVQYSSQEPIPEDTRPDQVIVHLDQRLRQLQVPR
jgi:hypothetical protein